MFPRTADRYLCAATAPCPSAHSGPRVDLMKELPLVTVVVPTLNEETEIAACIEAIGCQTYRAEQVQLILVDGCSSDLTVETARRAAASYRFAEVVILDNIRRRTSVGLNLALARATGQYVSRVDARSRIPRHYLDTSIGILRSRPEIGVVGGSQSAQQRSDRVIDVAIARALRNRWSTGLSKYRRSSTSQPSDTVWMGVFRTEDLRVLGGWAESVALNEDFELNRRYRESNKLVWYEASLISGYLPRRSLTALAFQYFYFGRIKGTWWARGEKPAVRQAALLAAPPVAAVLIVEAGRRVGWVKALLLGPGFLLLIDETGSTGPPSCLTARPVAAIAIGVYSLSWWFGACLGWIGEVIGAHHKHG